MISKWLLCRINLLLFPFVSEIRDSYLHNCSSSLKPFWAKALIFLRSAAAAANLHINNHLQNSSLTCSVSSIDNFEVERWKHGGQRVSGVYVKSEVNTNFSETWSGSSSYTLSLTQTHHPGGVNKRGQVRLWQNFLAGFCEMCVGILSLLHKVQCRVCDCKNIAESTRQRRHSAIAKEKSAELLSQGTMALTSTTTHPWCEGKTLQMSASACLGIRWTRPPRGGGGKICSQVVTHVTPWQWRIKVMQQLQTPTSLFPLT